MMIPACTSRREAGNDASTWMYSDFTVKYRVVASTGDPLVVTSLGWYVIRTIDKSSTEKGAEGSAGKLTRWL
jgi:hypothetical protein